MMDKIELFDIIYGGFDSEELKLLCLKLGVSLDDWEGGRRTKIIELVAYFERHGELERLEQVCRKMRPKKFRDRAPHARYKLISVPFDSIGNALSAIRQLSLPEIWPHLTLQRTLRDGGWMGSDSDELIDLLYAIYHPVITYRLFKSDIERVSSMLDWRARLQFSLLEFAFLAVQHDSKIAALEPAIEYTPRVQGWRYLREDNPQKFWWQGLSEQKFDNAVEAFIWIEVDSSKSVLSLEAFRQYYKKLYRNGSDADQQRLGLASNALYGFTPFTRPVYWRLLVIQSLLYQNILNTRSEDVKEPDSLDKLKIMLLPSDIEINLLGDVPPEAQLYESFPTTLRAAYAFIDMIVAPQTFLKIKASQYTT